MTAVNTHPAIVPDSFETSQPPLLPPKTKIRQSDNFFSENKEHKLSCVNLGDINNTNCNTSNNLNSFGVKAQSLINLNGHNQFFPTRPKLSLEIGKNSIFIFASKHYVPSEMLFVSCFFVFPSPDASLSPLNTNLWTFSSLFN